MKQAFGPKVAFTAAFLVCAIAMAIVRMREPGTLTEERFSQIEIGMNYNQVVELIGRPSKSVWKETIEDAEFRFCVWSPKTVNASVTFRDDRVYFKEW